MGPWHEARCDQCGAAFHVDRGGGFFFHLLQCDQCAEQRAVGFDELGETHVRYLKGLRVPYAIATREWEAAAKAECDGEPLAAEEYHSLVEEHVGGCARGGQFRFDAPERCPQCRSTAITLGASDLCYD